ncbi:Cytochrome bo(3) ubiquinol oxidase subunit 4 [Buchnera aphidicola (Cinara kochiana kochiana)]|uniref:Cytochrome bo(3) ubiquinol oxidase subunit 4 n=1 Tax=Buchnera aphidicola (Cinara kochiana kochiana) TaxID=2518976 RepID=A0A451D5S3_9GAMM|nr:cytochrome o ubiquinol oxidase subunit IV [Buchnera aphidicola]VFP81201.1 Cytochrome bo(3) ubiquinol oxidase subunit 4 [Buchnera aphidicola (Cinara kochiana kochiana)]
MLIIKKNIFIDTIMMFMRKKFFIGFCFSVFFIFLYFFMKINYLIFFSNYKWIFWFLLTMHIVIYFKYFIEISFSKKNFFIISSLIFIGIIISIITIGSLWIFDHLNH